MDNICIKEKPQDEKTTDFKPRAYQLELYERAKKQNSILVLGTGSGKTFISVLLIKDLGSQIRKSLKKDRKWTVFVVNTVPLVYQQGRVIQENTAFSVGMFERSAGVDIWTEDEWRQAMNDNEVLVIIAQMFLELVLHNQISLKEINLLILDECHHATGNHPMREVMREYEKVRSESPDMCLRVMGLTACVIHKKCNHDGVRNYIKELEKTMFSALTTSVDVAEVKKYSTFAQELVMVFPSNEISEYSENICAQVIGIQMDIDEIKELDDRQKRPLKRKLENIKEIITHLGDWCGSKAIKYEMENFEETEEYEDIPAMRELKKYVCQRLEEISKYCCDKEKDITNPLEYVSSKVKRLFDILDVCKEDVRGIIFVERRNTAKLLYDLLLDVAKICEKYSFIKPGYVISANSRSSTDINLLRNELKKQKETLHTFAIGESNFMISTSVLEEGLDVRKCNMVIRFDKPSNFRSYVQSRGRARAIPARYILMVEDTNICNLLYDVKMYREIEAVLSDICHSREMPTSSESAQHFAEDEHVAPYEPYGSDGPKVTFNSAINLINVYCGKLPQDKFTELAPEIVYEISEDEQRTIAGIRLPINACLRETIYGEWMTCREHAKKSAALQVCKKLHEINELDSRLRPKVKEDETLLDSMIELSLESTVSGSAEIGTRKRRQIYDRHLFESLFNMSDKLNLYSIIVKSYASRSDQVIIDSESQNRSLGILCKKNLRIPPFPLYSNKWNEALVRIELIDDSLQLNPKIFNHIEHFHKIVFETLLDISPALFDYVPQKASILILPMIGDEIDISLLSELSSIEILRNYDDVISPNTKFSFQRCVFEDAIIYPLYMPNSEPMYYITEILDHMRPQDPFPNTNPNYKSFEEYFEQKYSCKITNKCQPLLVAKHLPKDLNNLKKFIQRQPGKDSRQEPPKFVPELCGILPIKASLWWQVMLIPSVLQRINGLCVAEELNDVLISQHSFPASKCSYSKTDILEFDWSSKLIKKLVQHSDSNLSVILSATKPKPIHPYMILNALTLQRTNDNFDMERLEVLGDSFLKYAVADFMFLKFPFEHEGILSQRRSKLVSNKTLYSFGKCKHIPEKIQCTLLEPKLNGILPGFLMKNTVEKKLQEINVRHDKWPRFPDFNTLEEFKEEIKKLNDLGNNVSCYNPWKEQELGDKSVADCVEALIGVCLLVGGKDTAIDFMCNLGIGNLNGISMKSDLPVESALLSKEVWAEEELARYYEKYCLDRLEEKIKYNFRDKSFLLQAVTHSSFCQNKVTDCYQRLEFLGDAILDYLVTGIVFSNHTDYTPGQLSDLRSYYVKNETLARVAAENNLQCHLLHLAPKLLASIDKYLNVIYKVVDDEEILTEDDTTDWEEVEVPKAMGDLVEAIIGAVYLDSGKSLQITWEVVQTLMGDIIAERLNKSDIPINCIRKLYEMIPSGIELVKLPNEEKATYKLTIPGFPSITRSGKNYGVAKMAAAKAGIRMLNGKKMRFPK